MTDFSEAARAAAAMDAVVFRRGGIDERAEAHGVYTFECRGTDGKLKWQDAIENVVCTEGKNLAFDTFLAGSSYTKTQLWRS